MANRETEIKLRLDRPAYLRRQLLALGATLLRRRHFEDNFIFDFPNGKLRRTGSLLRVRLTKGKATLTYKGPSRVVARAKTRLELESDVLDGTSVLLMLQRMGLRCIFRYQKYRTVYRKGGALITIDETPIGNYSEIEGTTASIKTLAHQLRFPERDFITATYLDLFKKYRMVNRVIERNMIFGIKA